MGVLGQRGALVVLDVTFVTGKPKVEDGMLCTHEIVVVVGIETGIHPVVGNLVERMVSDVRC